MKFGGSKFGDTRKVGCRRNVGWGKYGQKLIVDENSKVGQFCEEVTEIGCG